MRPPPATAGAMRLAHSANGGRSPDRRLRAWAPARPAAHHLLSPVAHPRSPPPGWLGLFPVSLCGAVVASLGHCVCALACLCVFVCVFVCLCVFLFVWLCVSLSRCVFVCLLSASRLAPVRGRGCPCGSLLPCAALPCSGAPRRRTRCFGSATATSVRPPRTRVLECWSTQVPRVPSSAVMYPRVPLQPCSQSMCRCKRRTDLSETSTLIAETHTLIAETRTLIAETRALIRESACPYSRKRGPLFVGTQLENPSFAEVARAMGAEGIQVTHADQARPYRPLPLSPAPT